MFGDSGKYSVVDFFHKFYNFLHSFQTQKNVLSHFILNLRKKAPYNLNKRIFFYIKLCIYFFLEHEILP